MDPAQCGNRLLARLPAREYKRLSKLLEATTFESTQTLCRAREPLDYVYFPESGIASVMAKMKDGRGIEVATIGNEGMLGLLVYVGVRSSPHEIVVQVAGRGLRMRADHFAAKAHGRVALRSIIALYHAAFSVQISCSVACNGLHTVHRRCCRWLLMAQDRVGANALPLTHESLASILGVQRTSISDTLRSLQERGMIYNARSRIEILDRPGLESLACECYRSVKQEFERLFD